MPITIAPAHIDNADAIAVLAASTFTQAFGYLYTAENLATHLAATCSAEFFRGALQDKDQLIVVMREGDALVGYAKVGRVGLPLTLVPEPVIPQPNAQEIHRVYIAKTHQGRGLGTQLMQYLLALPMLKEASEIYLGVWEGNIQAQKLYTRCGFLPVGEYFYKVGTQQDRELILRHICGRRTP